MHYGSDKVGVRVVNLKFLALQTSVFLIVVNHCDCLARHYTTSDFIYVIFLLEVQLKWNDFILVR